MSQKELYERYKYQKKAEKEFTRIQAEIEHVEGLIANNPNLQVYYKSWLKQAKHRKDEYVQVLESPDNISFSVRNF
jgi:hypothetical protein